MKRFWVFLCGGYEPNIGLSDFVESLSSKKSAIALSKTGEWGAVFDSKTGEQYTFMGDTDEPVSGELFSIQKQVSNIRLWETQMSQ